MRNILISIKPEHCCNILNKDKILEIRTTCPMEWKKYLDGKTSIKPEPCKVYIYETKAKWFKPYHNSYINKTNYLEYEGRGKIIAEFILNEVEKLENTILPTIPTCVYLTKTKRYASAVEKASCLSQDKIYTYLRGRDGYAWHIDDLITYDKPKELSEFSVYDKTYDNVGAFGWVFPEEQKYTPLKRPPQSWCYVEEKGE